MTESDHSLTRECGADIAAYVLGALEDTELDGFRGHLETCIVCRDELVSFQQVADALPMSAPQHRAPKSLRRHVLAEVDADIARRGGARRRSAWRMMPSLTISRPAFALGAVLAAVVIAVGGLELGSSSGGPGTHVFHAQVPGSSGSAEVKVTGDHAELVVHHFALPPAGKIYEVWLGRAHQKPQPTSALFSPNSSGEGDVDVPGNVSGVQRVMVTAEPAGGTKVPTLPAVITAKLS